MHENEVPRRRRISQFLPVCALSCLIKLGLGSKMAVPLLPLWTHVLPFMNADSNPYSGPDKTARHESISSIHPSL